MGKHEDSDYSAYEDYSEHSSFIGERRQNKKGKAAHKKKEKPIQKAPAHNSKH